MAVLGRLLKNRRAGQAGLAWSSPNLAGPDTLVLISPAFENEATIPAVHAAKRVGGENVSPALAWSAVPEAAAQLLLVVEDPDAPGRVPFVHGVALLDPSLTSLAQRALNRASSPADVRILRSGMGRGYLGPGADQGPRPAPVRVPDLRSRKAGNRGIERRRPGLRQAARRLGGRR